MESVKFLTMKTILKLFASCAKVFAFLFIWVNVNWGWRILILFGLFLYSRKASWKKEDKLSMYFGVPGSGKTTFAAWYAAQAAKKDIPVYSNVPVRGTFKVERKDIGQFQIEDCLLIIDEASLEYNNRDFKNFKAGENQFYSLHRHYKTEVVFFSQGWEDADKRIRTLCQRLYYVRRGLLPGFIERKQIKKIVEIDQMSHQVIDGYKFQFLGWNWIYSRPLWKLFDSFDAPELPRKNWERWYPEVAEPEAADPEEAGDLDIE